MAPNAGVVLVAAGAGTRLGGQVPKALAMLGGRSLVTHAVSRLQATGLVRTIVVTAPNGHGEQVRRAALAAFADHEISSGGQGGADRVQVDVVEGTYPSRQASVAAGLARLDAGHEVILVHDAARPLAPSSMITRVVCAVQDGHDAVVPGLAVTDTIRMVDEQDTTRARGVVERARLRAMQTPQGFRAEVLRRAHASGAARGRHEYSAATDDAALVEALALEVHVVAGERAAMKVTDRHDLAVAQMYLNEGW